MSRLLISTDYTPRKKREASGLDAGDDGCCLESHNTAGASGVASSMVARLVNPVRGVQTASLIAAALACTIHERGEIAEDSSP